MHPTSVVLFIYFHRFKKGQSLIAHLSLKSPHTRDMGQVFYMLTFFPSRLTVWISTSLPSILSVSYLRFNIRWHSSATLCNVNFWVCSSFEIICKSISKPLIEINPFTKIRHLKRSMDISCYLNLILIPVYYSCVGNEIIRVFFFS